MNDAVTITVDAGSIERLLQDTRAAVRATTREAAAEAVERIKAGWPVSSGRSRDAWHDEARGDGAAVVNDEPYVGYIHDGAAVAEALATFERVAAESAAGFGK